MLSFSKAFRCLKDLSILFSINSYRRLKANGHYNSHSSASVQPNFFNTLIEEDKVVPLKEINNLSITGKIFNADKLAMLNNEITKFKSLGKKLPDYIKLSDIYELLQCETSSQKSRFLMYLFKKERIKLKSIEKKLKNKIERESTPIKVIENDHIQYGLGKNTLILRTVRRSLINFYNKRLANAVLFGQKIVIDLGYDKYMMRKEKRACISQIKFLYSCNKLNRNPYDLYFCNGNSENLCVHYLLQEMPNINQSFTTVTEKSYLDLFPKENLVYLSPHASEVLKNYDHTAIYIIGGFVDTVNREDVSSVRAQEEGIKSYRFPLDEFVLWGAGSRSLTINQVFSILQTLRDTGDWKEAFKHLPTRKLRRIDENSIKTKLYSDKLYVINKN